MRFLQVNLNRCKRAHDLLYQTSIERNIDFCIVSEPNILQTSEWGGNNNAKIWNRQNMYIEKTGQGLGHTWAIIGDYMIISVYSSGNESTEILDHILNNISNLIRRWGKGTIIAGDFNAKSPNWNERRLDGRGKKVTEWIASENLVIKNEGTKPTFKKGDQESIIDLTLCTENIAERITGWQVLDEIENGSDHEYICFEVQDNQIRINNITPPKKGWNIKTLKTDILKEIIDNQNETEELNARDITALTTEVCNKAMKKKGIMKRKAAHWWCEEIAQKRKICTQKRRTFTRNRGRVDEESRQRMYEEYREARREMNIEITKAKKRGWENICEELKKDIWGLGYKIVTKKIGKKLPNLPPEKREEIINQLFPNHNIIEWTRNTETENGPEISMEEITEAIFKMKNKKAPGPDMIPGEIIKEIFLQSPNLMRKTLNNLMQTREFPHIWKEAKVTLIEKPKKNNSDQPTYRPICLLNTYGKLLESLINQRIVKELEEKTLISDQQYGFRAGKSTVQAIQAVIDTAKKEMGKPSRKRNLCIVVTIDIKNAFNSASWKVIIEEMERMRISQYLIELLKSYLSDRKIVGEAFNRSMTAGVPQGSILGPTLWNILYNGILNIEVPENTKLIAYADDLAMVTAARNEIEIEQKANTTLKKISEWMKEKELEIAPEKTELISLTGQKRCRPLKIEIEGKEIEQKTKIKYLGVILDKNLKFGPHVEYVSEKANKAISALTRIMPRIGGPGEAKRRVLQNVSESIILYAAPVWEECLHIKKRRNDLLKAQRAGTIRVCCAYRTISTDAAAVISGVIPIDLALEERAKTFQKNKETKEKEREETLQKWNQRWQVSSKGRWTHKLIGDITPWYKRKHGEVGYHVTQLISGHGNFQAYKHRFKINDEATCMFCSEEDTAEHTLFYCDRWNQDRSTLQENLGTEVSTENLINLMLRNKSSWDLIEQFMKQIMKTKEEAERTHQTERNSTHPGPHTHCA